MNKDCSFILSDANGPVDVINTDYVSSIVHQVLYTKDKDPYSDRGCDINKLKYKTPDDCAPFKSKIKDDIEKYTDLLCDSVDFMLVKGTLFMIIGIKDTRGKSMTLAVDTDKQSVSSIIKKNK